MNQTKIRIGLLRLTDAAPVILAHEFGFFADEGVEVEIVIEPSWANIADKLAFGFLDAAVIVPPLAFAVELGLRGASQSLLVPYAISVGGNTVTLAREFAGDVRQRSREKKLPIVASLAECLREKSVALGIVHPYSTHNLLLRYWLATAGIEAGRDVKLVVVPPARAVEAMRSEHVVGFCAGAPWGKVAERARIGSTIATSRDIWKSAPEKVFAVRAVWANENSDLLQGVLRALLRASKFCDAPENASYTAALLARQQYLNVAGHAVLASLPGGTAPDDDVAVFFRAAATFPWRSHGLWFLAEMKRWGMLDTSIDLAAVAARVYRPDLYRLAAASMGVATPLGDWKREGEHGRAWTLTGDSQDIVMGADTFCDGKIFAPEEFGGG